MQTLVGDFSNSPGEKSQDSIEKLLKQIASKGHDLLEDTKAWKELKTRGRLALDEDGKKNFDGLYEILLKGGLLVNPCGELESVLYEYIEHSTDKRAWFEGQ